MHRLERGSSRWSRNTGVLCVSFKCSFDGLQRLRLVTGRIRQWVVVEDKPTTRIRPRIERRARSSNIRYSQFHTKPSETRPSVVQNRTALPDDTGVQTIHVRNANGHVTEKNVLALKIQ